MIDTSSCSIPLTSKPCWRKSARPSDPPPVVACRKRYRKARLCSMPLSHVENRRAARPHSSSSSWTPTGPPSCAVPSGKHLSATPHALLRWRSSSAGGSVPSNTPLPPPWISAATRNCNLSMSPLTIWSPTMSSPTSTMSPTNNLPAQLKHIGLKTLPANLDDFLARATKARWSPRMLLEQLAQEETQDRSRRSLERRLRLSAIKKFKPMADFEWDWPSKVEREVIERALTLDFIHEARNFVLVGQNGLGKTMIAQNICHLAVLAGCSVLFRTAAAIVEDLRHEMFEGRRRKLRGYGRADLLCIDELAYLSFDDKAADILYEVINRRYERRSVIVTTNRAFKEWNQVFPNATCIATLLDRLLHHADVTRLEGDSYRIRESQREATTRRKKP